MIRIIKILPIRIIKIYGDVTLSFLVYDVSDLSSSFFKCWPSWPQFLNLRQFLMKKVCAFFNKKLMRI